MTLSMSPQYRALMYEKSLSLLFPVECVCGGGGAVVTNDWCISIQNTAKIIRCYLVI